MFSVLKRLAKSVEFENIVYVENVPISNNTPTTVTQEKAKPKVTVKSYFAERGISVDTSRNKKTITAIEELAVFIANSFSDTYNFIRFLRERISNKKYDFSFQLSKSKPESKNKIIALAGKMYACGLLNKYRYDLDNEYISGAVSSVPRCVNFITGGFLEIYARNVVNHTVIEEAKMRNCGYEIYSNVFIEKEGKRNELDVVFRVGDKVFWSEVKSGHFAPEDYYKLGIQMGVVPDRLILLAAERTASETKSISYFYEYYCANIAQFESSLKKMIGNAFEERTDCAA